MDAAVLVEMPAEPASNGSRKAVARKRQWYTWYNVFVLFIGINIVVGAVVALLLLPGSGKGTSGVTRYPRGSSSRASTDRLPTTPQHSKTLKFQVCNGFANQRLALVYGLAMAKVLNRTAVLPNLLVDGAQYSASDVTVSDANPGVSFDQVYRLRPLQRTLRKHGISLITRDRAPPDAQYTQHTIQLGAPVEELLEVYNTTNDLDVGCPLFKVPAATMLEHEDLVWDTLAALQPAPHLQRQVNHALKTLRRLTPSGAFQVLHLRAETDWVKHCKNWEATSYDGHLQRNCLTNTYNVTAHLLSKGWDPATPLYLATHWPALPPATAAALRAALAAANFTLLTTPDLLPHPPAPAPPRPRELAALLDYHLALAAAKFAGNSVSTFSALAILERRRAGRWATHYNTGHIPLASFLPLDPLPWVFTYNSWSPSYDYMVKAAVRSAHVHGGLTPYCVFNGDPASPISRWLAAHRVILIPHEPSWAAPLTAATRFWWRYNKDSSPLFSNPRALVGTFQRIDIPVLPELLEHDYVLFTDADVYFNRRITLADFPLPLPPHVAMARENPDQASGWQHAVFNAGIMLMNLVNLRSTYPAFLKYILDNAHGMMYNLSVPPELAWDGQSSVNVPGDQGAYNVFYKETVATSELPQEFNARPFELYINHAAIVHFHGPKPEAYLKFFQKGECKFQADLCKRAFDNGLCRYAVAWGNYTQPSEAGAAQELVRLCEPLAAVMPHLLWIEQQVNDTAVVPLLAEFVDAPVEEPAAE